MLCACGVQFSVDHAMVFQRGGFIIQRHNELRDFEAEMLRMACNDVEVEPVLQEVTGETINHGANKAPDARLDIHARGFWERQICLILGVTGNKGSGGPDAKERASNANKSSSDEEEMSEKKDSLIFIHWIVIYPGR